jgi:hyperosmotically inducible protein
MNGPRAITLTHHHSHEERARTMRYTRLFGAFVFATVAIVAVPTYGMAQTTTDKVEQKAKGGAQDAKTGISDSWLTAKTKIALFADERVKGGQVSVETVNGTVSLRGKVDSDEAKAAAAAVTKAVDGVKSVRNDLQVVPPEDRKVIDTSDTNITRQVEGRLSKDTRLKKVDVRTDGGAVILTGAVPSIGASARASELARGVPGVRAVKNELTYDAAMRDRSGVTPTRSQSQVMAMQQALKERGFEPGPIDGVMGPRTASALKEYQKAENLKMTGRMDRDTAAKLGVQQVKNEKRQSP